MIACISFQNIFISMKETLTITNLLYVSMDLPTLDIPNKWNHIVCTLCVWLISFSIILFGSIPSGTGGKEATCQCRRYKRLGFDPWVGKIPWRRTRQPIPVFLHGESHGQRNQMSYSSWGLEESDMIEVN